jgi:acetamidase/formamidase family protein
VSPAAPADHAAIAASLAQLTSGWTPTPGIAPDTLTAAREALVASLLAGHSASDLHIVQPAVRADVPAEPRLAAELGAIATRIAAGPRPATTAIVRSPLAATLTNPTGVPAWARSAQVPTSLGPFLDIHGLPHWVDLIRITASMPIAFGNAASPFGVLPVRRLIPGPPAPTQLTLVAGSVWFTAKWLAATLPDGFTGFSITGGTLASSAPLSLQNGVYVAPAGATLTLKCTLAPAPVPAGPAAPGADALAARFMPPLNITIVFKQSSAVLQAVGDASATAYGSTVATAGVKKYAITNPIFKPSPIEPRFSEYLIFEGISVDEMTGKQHYLDAHIAYRRACLNAIEYLKKFGYSGEQAYMILGTAPCEGRISGIVDIPNACCTLAIPTEIFDFDILPNAAGPKPSVPAGIGVSKTS